MKIPILSNQSRLPIWLKFLFTPGPMPTEVWGYRYCIEWHCHIGELREKELLRTQEDFDQIIWPVEDKILFDPWLTGHASRVTSRLIDGLIPAKRFGDQVGLYKQVGSKYRDSTFYDGASWDDGYMVDLKFVRLVKAGG